ncbi:MAG: hypothetical protein H6R18_1555 [Proteobacteria bacterium]|nr:hypothetical protein [Pseudomonadota bacterium]
MRVFLVLLFASSISMAHAQGLPEYLSAARELDSLVIEATNNNAMPRVTDIKVAQLVSVLSDSDRFLNSTAYETKDLGDLVEICGKANAISMKYALFDLKKAIDPKTDQKKIVLRVQQVMEKNVLAFQDELELLQPFLIRCMAKQAPLMNDFMLKLKPEEITEIRVQGIRQARNGTYNMYMGFLQSLNFKGIKASYRLKLLRALSETAERYSAILQPEARQKIGDFAKLVQLSAPEPFRSDLKTIIEAMSATACDGLCKL